MVLTRILTLAWLVTAGVSGFCATSEKYSSAVTPDTSPALNLSGAQSWSPAINSARPGIAACLRIRSYKVARDTPHSDSTHLVGYTTCVPDRVRFYTTEDPTTVPPTSPR